MNVFKQGDSRVAKIINKKKLRADAQYRTSVYCYPYAEDGRYLLKHMLSFEVVELTEQEWNAFQQVKRAPVDYDFITQKGLEPLALTRYLVETDYNEVRQYQQTVFLLKTMAGNKKGVSSYTILPTTGCNARCVYCYEEGYPVRTMTTETADRLVDYICETRHDDTVKLLWFGGEPTAARHIIRHICEKLRERGVPYKSSMITNASLVTKDLAHEAKELWRLKHVQVSLDGAREDYAPRKNYYNPEKHNYDVVMRAIHYFADEDIRVNLRVNVDFGNIDRIDGFLREIKAEFGDMKNISLYLAPLFQEKGKDSILELHQRIFVLQDYMKKIGITQGKVDHETVRIRTNYCMADVVDKSVVITPDGAFNNCEHLPEAQIWGNIFDGVTDQPTLDRLLTAPKVDEECAKCPFLPECTPFYKTGCPGWFERCYEYHCMKTEYALHNLLKGVNIENDDDDEEL